MRTLARRALAAAIVLSPSLLSAQGLTVQSVVDMRFQGGLGTLMNMAARMSGTSMHDIATTTYLQGHRLRTETAASGMVIDLDAERIINIDHKQKTYSSTTFAEMMAAMEQARASAEQSRAKEQAKEKKRAPAAEKQDSVNVKYHVAVDRTGQRERVAGYDAERVFLTITLEAEATPEGKKTEQVGSMVFFIDQWIAANTPQKGAYAEFYKSYSQKLGREFRGQVQGMQAAFASDARLKDGFEAAGKEMQKLQGVALRSTTHVALVPANTAFDRKQALDGAASSAAAAKADDATKEDKPKKGFGGLMGALKKTAEEMGKQQDNKDAKKDEPPKQTTLMVLVDEVKSISTGSVSAEMFAAPAEYKEVKRKAP